MSFPAETLEEVLEDLQSRFIINVPEEELSSVERICFQIEQAHWFYEDFVREQNTRLPSLSLKSFSGRFFAQCPLLKGFASNHEEAFQTFLDYKIRVPVCGAIILNEDLDMALLVRGWKASAGWGFPKGKINRDEGVTSCAIREVFEETGFDISPYLDEEEYVERTIKEQTIRLYIIKNVPLETVFQTRTRKEIGAIEWHLLKSLPGWSDSPIERGKYFMVVPFIPGLRRWINKYKKGKKRAQKAEKRKVRSLLKDRSGNASAASGYKSATDYESTEFEIESESEKKIIQNTKVNEIALASTQLEPRYLEEIEMTPELIAQRDILKQLLEMQQSVKKEQLPEPVPKLSKENIIEQNLLQILNIRPSQSLPTATSNTNSIKEPLDSKDVSSIDPTLAIKSILGIGTAPQPQASQTSAFQYGVTEQSHQNGEQYNPITPQHNSPFLSFPPTSPSTAGNIQFQQFIPQNGFLHRPPLIPVSSASQSDRAAHKESLLAILQGVPEPPKAYPTSLSRSSTLMGLSGNSDQFNSRAAIANLLLSSALSPSANIGASVGRRLSSASGISNSSGKPPLVTKPSSDMFKFSCQSRKPSVIGASPRMDSTFERRESKSSIASIKSEFKTLESPMEQICSVPRTNEVENKKALTDILFDTQSVSSSRFGGHGFFQNQLMRRDSSSEYFSDHSTTSKAENRKILTDILMDSPSARHSTIPLRQGRRDSTTESFSYFSDNALTNGVNAKVTSPLTPQQSIKNSNSNNNNGTMDLKRLLGLPVEEPMQSSQIVHNLSSLNINGTPRVENDSSVSLKQLLGVSSSTASERHPQSGEGLESHKISLIELLTGVSAERPGN